MKKVKLMMTEEDLVPGPGVDSPWIVEFENIGDTIKLTDDFEGAYDPPFTFETEEYGECRGISNPFSYAHYGYFGVLVPQADGAYIGISTDERIIATIMDRIDKCRETPIEERGKYPLYGELKLITDKVEIDRVYKKLNIPRYTVI